MSTKSRFKMLFVTALFAAALILGAASTGLTSFTDPPPEGSRYAGPAIIGTLTFDGNYVSFSGKCKGADVILAPAPWVVDLSTVTEENIEGFYLAGVGPAGCHSEWGGEGIIVNTVTSFTNTGLSIIADVVILFVL